tara:strand:- start:253 stop:501 length:249 start_codon:yes stop_codon:yes gene_type:complete
MGNLTVPNGKTEAQVYLEHRDDAIKYLNGRRDKKLPYRITMQEIIDNTSVEKLWEAKTIYREWLRDSAQEKFDNESSTEETP